MKRINTRKYGQVIPDRKIGEGTFRTCYTVAGHNDMCVKLVKSDFTFGRRMQAFFLRRRTNMQEFARYLKLPNEIKPYFNPIIEADRHYSITTMPRDYDGSYSRSVFSHGKVSNPHFWQEVDKLYRFLLEHNLWYFDVLNGKNMFIRKESEHQWFPVIVDYKRLGPKGFPWQVHLWLRSEKRKKMARKYAKLLTRHKLA